jgi:hypothetical protein
LHKFFEIGNSYSFHNLKTCKIKACDETKKVLLYTDNSNAYKDDFYFMENLPEPQKIDDVVSQSSEASEFDESSLSIFSQHSSQSPKETHLISYVGEITRIIDASFGIYELDSTYELYATFCQFDSLFVRVGAIVSLFNAHLMIDRAFGNVKAFLVLCPCSVLSLKVPSPIKNCIVQNQKADRKWILSKFDSFGDILAARSVKKALFKVLGEQVSSLKNLSHEVSDFALPRDSSKKPQSKPEFSILEFVNHYKSCNVLERNPQLIKLITPKELIQALSKFDLKTIPQKDGYGFKILEMDDLQLQDYMIIGILDSDHGGNLCLKDLFQNQIMCICEGDVRLDFRHQLRIFKSFTVVIEIIGDFDLGHYVLKTYIKLKFENSKAWTIIEKKTSPRPHLYPYLLKVMYKRPASLDISNSQVSCVIEGIVWEYAAGVVSGGHKRGVLKIVHSALATLPFITEGKYYILSAETINLKGVKECIMEIDQDYSIRECEHISVISSLESSTTFPFELPALELDTIVTGYSNRSYNNYISELVSLQGKIIDKSIFSSPAWNLGSDLSPQELSNHYNIGIGINDGVIVLVLQDVYTDATLKIYCDFRKSQYLLDAMPGAVISIERMGIQVSKSKNLFGKCLPITSIDIKSHENYNPSLSYSIEKELPIVLLRDTNTTEKAKVIGNLVQIKKVILKRNFYKSCNDSTGIFGSMFCKIQDGTMECFGDIDTPSCIFKIIKTSDKQQAYLEACVSKLGEVRFADEFKNEESEKSCTVPVLEYPETIECAERL